MRTIQENYQTKKIVGQCEAMRKVIQLALTIARRPINTLILGPTGAGKDHAAAAVKAHPGASWAAFRRDPL